MKILLIKVKVIEFLEEIYKLIKKIKLLKDIEGYMMVFKKGEIIEPDEPYQGFNDDGTFTICTGMGIYHTIEKNNFEIINEE